MATSSCQPKMRSRTYVPEPLSRTFPSSMYVARSHLRSSSSLCVTQIAAAARGPRQLARTASSSVDFPHPLGPRSACISPLPTSRLTSTRTCFASVEPGWPRVTCACRKGLLRGAASSVLGFRLRGDLAAAPTVWLGRSAFRFLSRSARTHTRSATSHEIGHRSDNDSWRDVGRYRAA